MVLQLGWIHLARIVVGWILVHVWHEDGLRVGRLDMFARAAIAVTACTDFVVKGAVDLVLLGSEDGGEIIGHDGGSVMEGGET